MAELRAVVCEDDPTVRRVIGSVLRDHDIDVIAEIDMITPLCDVVRHGRPDVVILDLMLAGMAEIESLEELAKVADAVPVVVFSSYDQLRDDVMESGAYAFVDKPDFEMLITTVLSAVATGRGTVDEPR
ncbi:MAG TPA: response regulator [Acidimicrobiales bacterium]|jgi:DNA-binding NarL/FixJ family response regulator|nr:response regulator [Acidimicrobiales bacterium]